MTTNRDWDIKLTLGSTSHKFRLLQVRGQKAWTVQEVPPNPRVEVEAASREGFRPDRELPFVMEDWSWGIGLERFGIQTNEAGYVLRYADGFGIDTSQPSIVQHGPLETSVGALAAGQNPKQFILFQDEISVLTDRYLYTIEGGSPVEKIDFVAVTAKNMEVFGGKLYIATDKADTYSEWDGTTHTERTVTDGADLFLAVQGESNPILVRVRAGNFISTTINPADSTTWDSPGIEVGDDDAITNLFVLSGLVFVATQSTIFVLAVNADGVFVPIELNKLLRTRRSANAFSIKSESGSDAWLSDGKDTFRMVAEGFELFDIRSNGPFRSFDERPVTSAIKGDVTAIAQDLDAVYILAERGSDVYVYKGFEVVRGRFAWSPWAKFTGTNAAAAVLKTTSDSDPILYAGKDNNIIKFPTANWTTYAASWELITPQFTATLESWDKMWRLISAFTSLTGTGKLEVYYRLNNTAAWSEFTDATAGDNDMTTDGHNQLKLAAPINGKKIQLRLVGSNTTSTDKVDLRSFNLEGLLRPEYRPIFDFTIIADTETEVTFIKDIRQATDKFFTLLDRFNTARTAFLLPGYPIEQEQTDEVRKEPVRTYRLLAQEVV